MSDQEYIRIYCVRLFHGRELASCCWDNYRHSWNTKVDLIREGELDDYINSVKGWYREPSSEEINQMENGVDTKGIVEFLKTFYKMGNDYLQIHSEGLDSKWQVSYYNEWPDLPEDVIDGFRGANFQEDLPSDLRMLTPDEKRDELIAKAIGAQDE